MNLNQSLPSSLRRPDAPARRALHAGAIASALLLCICYLPLGCMAQQRHAASTAEPAVAAPVANASASSFQPQRLFPREALSLQTPNAGTRSIADSQPQVRRVAENSPPTSLPATTASRGMGAAAAPRDTGQDSGGVTDLSYTLAENDRIRLNVFREPDLSIDARIGKDGTISVPYIGTVRVAGKSVREATRLITALLDDGYLVNPQVSVTLVEYSKRQFTVLGQVRNPGPYTMPDDQLVTLQQAIGMAGGFTPGAKRGKVVVTRTIGGENIIYNVDGTAFMRDRNAKSFMILPDDTIFVPETFF